MKTFLSLLVFPVALFLVRDAAAQALPLESGEWKVTTSSESPMAPGTPQIQTATECVRQENWDPTQALMKDGSECRVTEQKLSGNTLRWSIECPNPMGPITGNGEFTSAGASAEGKMEMHMSMQGRSMSFRSTWKGERIGECP